MDELEVLDNKPDMKNEMIQREGSQENTKLIPYIFGIVFQLEPDAARHRCAASSLCRRASVSDSKTCFTVPPSTVISIYLFLSVVSTSNGLQPASNGTQPNSSGLQPNCHGLQGPTY